MFGTANYNPHPTHQVYGKQIARVTDYKYLKFMVTSQHALQYAIYILIIIMLLHILLYYVHIWHSFQISEVKSEAKLELISVKMDHWKELISEITTGKCFNHNCNGFRF